MSWPSSRSARPPSRAPDLPKVARPGEAEIHWEERGDGPTVLVALHGNAHPGVYAGLVEELAGDRTVVTYDPRGTGRSTRITPTSIEEDVADLEAVARAAGDDAVAVGFGDGLERAARVAHGNPKLIGAVVSAGATVAPAEELVGSEGLGASPAVVEAMVELAEGSLRAGVREMLSLTNPDMSDEDVRARVDATFAYTTEEAARARHRWFRAGGALGAMRDLGDRAWIAHWPSEWSTPDTAQRLQDLLPEAHVAALPEGPIARPDLTAAVVRAAGRG